MALLLCAVLAAAGAIAQPEGAADPSLTYVKPSPWRPPFGLDRPGTPSIVRASVPDYSSTSTFTVEVSGKNVPISTTAIDGDALSKGPVDIPVPTFADRAVLVEERGGKRASIAAAIIRRDELEVEAVVAAGREPAVNPIDLGIVLPPRGWLVLGPKQGAELRVAASWNGEGDRQFAVRAWFSHAADIVGTASLRTSRHDRETVKPIHPFDHTDSPAPWEAHVSLPPPPMNNDRCVLHVLLEDESGAQRWSKDISVMLVANPPKLPAFGAVAMKLRYDPPISVLDRETNTLSTIPYGQGWDPSLLDVVVALPGGGRFVFWRGSSYVPFWASPMGTGLSYEWAESAPLPGGFVDSVEPLMDKELRYGRVEIVESTLARVHVRWTYQSTDFNYKVWGDAAQEDFYFYPDGYGTRVLTLKSALDSNYELSEFIVIAPQGAYPLSFLPMGTAIHTIDLDGEKNDVLFPKPKAGEYRPSDAPERSGPVTPPLVYRVPLHVGDSKTAIYFSPRDSFRPAELMQFGPFFDNGEMATPAYWGSHWPLSRGKTTGGAIDDRIAIAPSHNSLLTWAQNRPAPLWERQGETIDALGRAKAMRVQQWAWLIGYTAAPDDVVVNMARSVAHPPSIENITGARLSVESYSEARRAICMTVENRDVSFQISPHGVCTNPVFELANAPGALLRASVGALELSADSLAWDGHVLWMKVGLRNNTTVRIAFAGN